MAATIHPLPSCGVPKDHRKISRSKDLLWREFFKDPSQWWDNRHTKPSPRHPDFKHKVTGEPLWLDSWGLPSWVRAELRNQGLLEEPSAAALSSAQIDSFIASLRACTRSKDLVRGTSIHHDVVQKGLLEECSDAVVTMYAKCGELDKAKALFDVYKSKDVITWTALIAGYARQGRGQSALDCLAEMQREGILPNAVTYVSALKACATLRDLDRGKQLHEEIARQGLLQNNIMLASALVDMYAKCRATLEAHRLLEELPFRDVVCWSALIAGYTQEGEAEQALNCLGKMQHEGILPDAVTYVCALKACATIRAADRGKKIHDEILREGLLQKDIILGGALVDMYARGGAVSIAQQVLKELRFRNVVSWNALIGGYALEGQAEQAMSCLEQMHGEGIVPNAVTYVSILKACALIRAADKGKKIHDEIARQGLLQNDIVLGNALVDMYAKCGDMQEARRVLGELSFRDVVSWNALIAGYAQEGEVKQALLCIEQMQHEGVLPDAVTCACVLKVCSHQGLVEEGQALFLNMSTKYGVKPCLECYTCMIDLFGRAGHLDKAVKVIQEMPSSDYLPVWHALLGVCQKWADVNVAGWAFEQAVKLDKRDESAYALMANIYAAAGMGEEAKRVIALRARNKS